MSLLTPPFHYIQHVVSGIAFRHDARLQTPRHPPFASILRPPCAVILKQVVGDHVTESTTAANSERTQAIAVETGDESIPLRAAVAVPPVLLPVPVPVPIARTLRMFLGVLHHGNGVLHQPSAVANVTPLLVNILALLLSPL